MEHSANILSINGCRAIKKGDMDKATEFLKEALEAEDKVFLETSRSLFQMAVRRHNYDILAPWLDLIMPRFEKVVSNADLLLDAKALLETLVFCVCDHRLHNLFNTVGKMIILLDSACTDHWQLKDFFLDLASLSARMSLREWNEETIWLLFLVLDSATHKHDIKFLDTILFQVDLNSVMYAKNFGLDAMFELYKQAQFTYIYLINTCSKEEFSHDEALAFTRLALRNERNLMTNLARATDQEEYLVYQSWFKNMWNVFSENDMLRTFSIFLVRMTIEYWHRTKPDSSQKEIPQLANIAESESISGPYKEILEEIT